MELDSQNAGENAAGDPGPPQRPLEDVLDDLEKFTHNPVDVKRKNKIICTTAYVILIISLVAYTVCMGALQAKYKSISSNSYFAEPVLFLYIIIGSDIIASVIGIYTCLAKTGPKPMIFACVWLLLSSLANLCVTISLAFENKKLCKTKHNLCVVLKNNEQCKGFDILKIFLWCSLCFIALKTITIFLCRFNYPQVFNWMYGKNVLVDERLVPDDLKELSKFAGAYFDPCDIQRLTARGSLGGTVMKTESQHTIVVQPIESAMNVRTRGSADNEEAAPVSKRKRSTLVSLSSMVGNIELS